MQQPHWPQDQQHWQQNQQQPQWLQYLQYWQQYWQQNNQLAGPPYGLPMPVAHYLNMQQPHEPQPQPQPWQQENQIVEQAQQFECYICKVLKTPQPSLLQLEIPPQMMSCSSCLQGLKSLLAFTSKLQNDKGLSESTNTKPVSMPMKGFQDMSKWVKETYEKLKDVEELKDYLDESICACREQIKPDIQVKSKMDGPSLSTHRALLARRSDIFKNMLESDECKAPPGETITLAELNHEELECFLEFLYCGKLPVEKMMKHLYMLSMMAHKYEISYLEKSCEHQMRTSLNTSNALLFLEISDTYSSKALKEAILKFIVNNFEDIVCPDNYNAFVEKNPHLSADIARACYWDKKKAEDL